MSGGFSTPVIVPAWRDRFPQFSSRSQTTNSQSRQSIEPAVHLAELNAAIDVRGIKAIDDWPLDDVALAYRTAYWWSRATRETALEGRRQLAIPRRTGARADQRSDRGGATTQEAPDDRWETQPRTYDEALSNGRHRRGSCCGPFACLLYAVQRRLRKTWTIHQVRDYVQEPKDSGSRAIHLIARRDNRLIEVQLRTFRQDAWANQIQEDGRVQMTALKFGEGQHQLHDYYRAVSNAFAALDRGEPLGGKIEHDLVETFRKVRPILVDKRVDQFADHERL